MAFSISDYTDFSELGKGGMGKVYLATQTSLNRKVVIKEIASGLKTNPAQVKRFENEAKSAASLDHDNIIRIYDFGEDRGSFFIAMEYIDGPNLNQLLSWQSFPREIGLMVVLQALKGLMYAHQNGIIHRDVKPDNILITKTGRAKISDFGLAHADHDSLHVTAAHAIVGTPAYMSPEMARSEQIKDQRLDIWSVGVLLYRLLSGNFPFTGNNLPTMLYNIVYSKEPDLREIVPALPPDLGEQIALCLEKSIDKRLATISPVIESLQHLVFELGIPDTATEVERYIATQNTGNLDFHRTLFDYHIRKGNEFSRAGDMKKSKAHFDAALQLDPTNQNLENFVAGMDSRLEAETFVTTMQEGSQPTPGKEKSTKNRKFIFIGAGSALVLIVVAAILGMFFARPIQKIAPQPLVQKPQVKNAAPPGDQPEPLLSPSAEQPDQTNTIKEQQNKIQSAQRQQPVLTAKPKTSHQSISSIPASGTKERSVVPMQHLGVVKISVDPSNASVYINGEKTNVKEMVEGKWLKTGMYTLSAEAVGYESYNKPLIIDENTTQVVSIALKTKASPLVGGSGTLHVFSSPWAELYIDGTYQGNTPTSKPLMLPAGRHTMVLKRDGYNVFEKNIEITNGEAGKEKVTLEKQQ